MTQPNAILLLTRPKAQSDRFATEVQGMEPGLEIVISPLLEIVPTGAEIAVMPIGGVVFTSSNGVLHCRDGDGQTAFCVGEATTNAARNKGWNAVTVGGTAEELITGLIERPVSGPLLHVAGRHKRGKIAQNLSAAGIETDTLDVYEQRRLPLSDRALAALDGGKPVIVPLFSPRTAGQFAQEFKGRAPIHIIALSDAVMQGARSLPATSRETAKEPDAKSLIAALRNLLRRVEANGSAK